MKKIKHSQRFEISQPIDMLFPLFSAEGEKLWVPGWDYQNIMGTTELCEDYVFLTANHDHTSSDAIWLVKRYEPQQYRVQFYKVEAGDKVGIIEVQCFKKHDSLTEVKVTYEYIALSEKGEAFITDFTASKYQVFIAEWQTLLNDYYSK